MIKGKSFPALKYCLVFFAWLIILLHPAYSQDSIGFWDRAPEQIPQRVRGVAIGLGSAYAVSMIGLYSLWYKDYPSSSFHTFNDNDEWLQMDKAGHFGSAYYLSNWGINLFQWTGMNEKKATWIGGASGLAFLTTIEVFDGFSSEWGFSWGDMIANTTGSALAVGQELAWKEQRIKIRFSWHPTDYSDYNPQILGDGFPETLIKDYNGQTYWASANIYSFLPGESRFPKWLNIAIGYGAEGMTRAGTDPSDTEIPGTPEFERYRQFYIAPDIDLSKFKTNNRVLKTFFGVIGCIKFPTPALEINGNDQIKFHWFYF
ncbi:MAG TPA: DUF2279 domain-containing protein [Bacteroidia bacterium]|nr:DUF2279 domain-containing protein [Bacteroidia bacterium]